MHSAEAEQRALVAATGAGSSGRVRRRRWVGLCKVKVPVAEVVGEEEEQGL